MAHHYAFAAPQGVFGVRSAIDLSEPIRFYAGRWPWRPVAAMPQPDMAVEQGDDGRFVVRLCAMPDLSLPASSPVELASAVIDVLARLCLERLGAFADLHAGSVAVDGRLIVFPGASMAGKSTLALQLMARGHLLGGDDRLLIGPLDRPEEAIEGMMLGLNARVRLPINQRAGDAFVRFVEDRRQHASWLPRSIGFVFPRAAEMAGFGWRRPVGAIVMPLRADGGGVRLESASFSDIMKLLLEQLHAPHLAAVRLVEAARRLAHELPCFVLRFDDSAAAAQAVERLARSEFRDGR